MRCLVRAESWPIAGEFRIARGARGAAQVVVVELACRGRVGRGECVPYARYGESQESVRAAIESTLAGMQELPSRAWVQEALAPGAARNAIDCALWDLESKQTGQSAWELAGLGQAPAPMRTMRTVSVDAPEKMAEAARSLARAQVLKVKVDGGDDLARLRAVHESVPDAKLVVDPNEGWNETQLERWLPELAALGVVVLEQPLPADRDRALAAMRGQVPLCADESFHDRSSFAHVRGRYDLVNVKLDKAGGLTEALACMREATAQGFGTMVGCMVATSLAVAPALLLEGADYVDLDGPLLLERDRAGARHDAATGTLHAAPSLWG